MVAYLLSCPAPVPFVYSHACAGGLTWNELKAFLHELHPTRDVQNDITEGEVRLAAHRLSYGQACGHSRAPAEQSREKLHLCTPRVCPTNSFDARTPATLAHVIAIAPLKADGPEN